MFSFKSGASVADTGHLELATTIMREPDTAPRLEICDLDSEPFSQSFSDILQIDCSWQLEYEEQKYSAVDISYDIEYFTNLKEIEPEWDDDEVDEILVMSPKPSRQRLPTIAESISEMSPSNTRPNSTDFECIQVLSPPECNIKSLLCRKRNSARVYVLKSTRKLAQLLWLEQAIVEVIQRLRCPFLPQLHWTFDEDQTMYMILDHYPAGNIFSYIIQYGAFELPLARRYAAEVATALSSLHAAGIIHCDLSPETLMIDSGGHVILTNFENAEVLVGYCHDVFARKQFISNGRGGGKQYQAPEMLLGWTHDFAVDCWGFGISLFFMLCGTLPFEGLNNHGFSAFQAGVSHGTLQAEFARSMHPEACDLISKCLEQNPVMRLDINGIKKHMFFAVVDWKKISSRQHEVRRSRDLLSPSLFGAMTRSSILSKPLPLRPEFEPSSAVTPTNTASSLTTLQDIQELPEIFKATTTLASPILPQEELFPDSDPFPSQLHVTQEVKCKETSKERLARFWDSFDADQDATINSNSSQEFGETRRLDPIRPQKLRKHRSSIFYSGQRLLNISTSSFHNKLRKKPKSTSTLRQARPVEAIPDLPCGVEQIGHGIAYSYESLAASRSKVSVCTNTPRACLPGALNLGIGWNHGLKKARAKDLEATKDESTVQESSTFLQSTPSLLFSPQGSLPSPMGFADASSPISDTTLLTPATIDCQRELSLDMKIKESVDFEEQDKMPPGVTSTLRLVPAGLRLSFLEQTNILNNID